MKLNYTYDKEQDIWCLLNKGRSSNNSPYPTKVYEKLVQSVGENPDIESTSNFIDAYIKENNIDIPSCVKKYQSEFDEISEEFHKIAQKVFSVSLKEDITVYLTINNRCPYSIKENLFFVSISNVSALKTAMHELWHFYTWHTYSVDEVERIGSKKYNNIKESLTVLLNVECKHLLPEGIEDIGYPQHQELRSKILKMWQKKQDINFVWSTLSKE